MKKLFLLITLIFIQTIVLKAQVTGLSGWNIYLDPGHSQSENVGIYGYSEAHKVLRVGLNLREMLLNETDIDTVYICRTNDEQIVGLSQRSDHANSLGAAWYHSIHSDAASNNTSNSTLLLWGQNGNGTEKVPNGGKAMSSHMVELLTRGYRTTTRGSIGDCSFYGTCATTDPPYLSVNRRTTMPSELSEAGFHTSAIQNMFNMNNNWKKLEARIFFWAILKHKNISRPPVRIVAGHVKDSDHSTFVNGAVVTINGQTITTDTYESLFKSFSSNPDQLRNGFFYFEGLPAGTHTLTVSAPGYDNYTTQVAVSDTFFTFVDPLIISSLPPVIASTVPAATDSIYPGYDNIVINFNRPMDRASVESSISINPSAVLSFAWSEGDKKLVITTENLAFNSDYILTISGSAKDKYNHPFDGNGDKTGGDSYDLNFRTKILDIMPPAFAQLFPGVGETNTSTQPLINITFDEVVNTGTLSNKFKVVKSSDQTLVSGILKHYAVNGRSVLNLFVKNKLVPFTNYTIQITRGIKDVHGNEITTDYEYAFTTGDSAKGTLITLDNFETGISNWVQSTANGIVQSETAISSSTAQYSFLFISTKSMKLAYSWNASAGSWLLREYYGGPSYALQGTFSLQSYIFGDGKNNQFRFAVKDGGAGGYEVSPWYNINWSGWKEVVWTPSVDGFGQWVGDGVLQGTVNFDSYQFSYTPGSAAKGEYYFDDARAFSNPNVDVKDEGTVKPKHYSLDQNYPNPFNPSTSISFSLMKGSYVKLEVYNLIGQKVATLLNQQMEAGFHKVNFDAGKLTSGVYIYKLTSDEFTSSKKMILMK